MSQTSAVKPSHATAETDTSRITDQSTTQEKNPVHLPHQSSEDIPSATAPNAGQQCFNCGTTRTPLWRRSPEGKLICNACGLYLRANNAHRPVNLKKPPNYVTISWGEARESKGSCQGDGRCNGMGGKEACLGCPAFNNRVVVSASHGAVGYSNHPTSVSQNSGHEGSPHQSMGSPTSSSDHDDTGDSTLDGAEALAIACTNCHTTITPLWRRSPSGSTICNACGLYYKLHSQHRPVKLKKATIKRRKRNPTTETTVSQATGLDDTQTKSSEGERSLAQILKVDHDKLITAHLVLPSNTQAQAVNLQQVGRSPQLQLSGQVYDASRGSNTPIPQNIPHMTYPVHRHYAQHPYQYQSSPNTVRLPPLIFYDNSRDQSTSDVYKETQLKRMGKPSPMPVDFGKMFVGAAVNRDIPGPVSDKIFPPSTGDASPNGKTSRESTNFMEGQAGTSSASRIPSLSTIDVLVSVASWNDAPRSPPLPLPSFNGPVSLDNIENKAQRDVDKNAVPASKEGDAISNHSTSVSIHDLLE